MQLNEDEIVTIKQLLNSNDIDNHKLAVELAIGYGGMTYNHLAECIVNDEWLESKTIFDKLQSNYILFNYTIIHFNHSNLIYNIHVYKDNVVTDVTGRFEPTLFNIKLLPIIRGIIEDIHKT